MRSIPSIVALLVLLCRADAGEVRLRCIADTNLSSYPTEVALNYGRSPRIRLKGKEMWMLATFDTAPIAGWRVRAARLRLHAAGPHKLKTIGISTVAVPWAEGTGNGVRADGGATFLESDAGRRAWGGAQSDFTDAAWTAAGTRVAYSDLREIGDGWIEVDVPPAFVHALADGQTYGFAITDEKGQTRANNDVHSREQSGFEPYLLVEGRNAGRKPEPPPARPTPRPTAPAPSPLRPVALPPIEKGTPVESAGLRIWAYPDIEKAHPVSGNLLEEVGPQRYAGPPAGDYRRGNRVWDARRHRVPLTAARGEWVAFHLCVEAVSGSARFTVSTTAGRGAADPLERIYADWCVSDGEWYPELAVPVRGELAIPDPANRIEGQRNRSLLIEYYVPRNCPPGARTWDVVVQPAHGAPIRIPVQLTVRPFTLPDELGFDVDLNAYGPPGDAATERAFHRMAHEHRATLDILGYNQSGHANPDYVPKIEGQGAAMHVADWSEFDKRFGPYFDGSAFAGTTRGPVPLLHAYLPFCEGWPSDFSKHYRYRPTTTAYPDCVVEHALTAPPIEEAFDATFRQEFQAVARDFARHFKEKGWNRTTFEFFMNDKVDFRDPKQGGRGSSWWLLDEPMFRDDWLALRFFGKLFLDAVRPIAPKDRAPRFVFRADVSRPQWQRDWLDGLVNLMAVSGEFYTKNERCLDMQWSQGIRFRNYAEANGIREANGIAVGWALKAFLAGADGILPWNSLGGDEAFEQPTPTALLAPGKRVGVDGPVASLRLKALRRGQQDVEYLRLLANKRGWSPAQLAAALTSVADLSARSVQRFADDAGRTVFDHLDGEALFRLRETVARELEKQAGRRP